MYPQLNLILVESLNFNLLSVAQLYDLGFKCIFGVDDVEIISVDSSNLIFKGFRYENLYLVDFNAREPQLSTCLLTKSSMGWLWYRRLGHVGMKQLNKLIKHDLVRGLVMFSMLGAFGKMKCLFSIARDAKFLVVGTFEQGQRS